jgi:hypothetical protein
MEPPGHPCAGGGTGGAGVGRSGVGAGVGVGGFGVGAGVAHRLGSGPCTTVPVIFRFETVKVEAPKLPSPPHDPGTHPVHWDEYMTAPCDFISLPGFPAPLI